MKRVLFLLIASLLFSFCGNQAQISEEPILDIKTSEGTIRVKLYKETPLHRDNFMQLVAVKYYNGVIFHRVIKNFMIQAGETGKTPTKIQLETNIDYTVPAEILPEFSHKRGSLAAARMPDHVNPQKASSCTQFYIVHTDNGANHLDGNYTVFGEVIDGFDVIDIIANKTVIDTRPAQEVKIISILTID